MDNDSLKLKHILVAEDDESLQGVIRKLLESAGYKATCVSNGQQAKNVISLEPFDLLLTDIRMPGMNGIELLHYVKKNLSLAMPVILMTGFSEISETMEASELGANGFLAKPFKKAEVLELITKLAGAAKTAEAKVEKDVDEEFVSIPIDDFVSGSEIQYSIYIRISGTKYIKVAHGGEKLDMARIAMYKLKGIHNLFLEKKDFAKYVGFHASLADAVVKSNALGHDKKVRFLTQSSANIVQSFYQEEINKESFQAAQQIVQTSLGVLTETPTMLLLLENLHQHSDHLYAHCLGVSLFSTMMAKELGWKTVKTQMKVSMCGLMHDIGKKEISQEILNKPRVSLSVEEVNILETHATRGMEILYQIPGIPEEIVQVAAQHHEECMGHGYPNRLTKNKITPLARLVSIANEFCNIAIKNPSSPGYIPSEALGRLLQAAGNRFDPEYLQALQKVISAGAK